MERIRPSNAQEVYAELVKLTQGEYHRKSHTEKKEWPQHLKVLMAAVKNEF